MKDYGNGKSPGLEQTVAGKILTGFVPADVSMTAEDRQVLRELAERGMHAAAQIERELRRPLAEALLFGPLAKGGKARVDLKDGRLCLSFG